MNCGTVPCTDWMMFAIGFVPAVFTAILIYWYFEGAPLPILFLALLVEAPVYFWAKDLYHVAGIDVFSMTPLGLGNVMGFLVFFLIYKPSVTHRKKKSERTEIGVDYDQG